MRSMAGVGIRPPKVLGAPKPTSSVMISNTFGAPFGGTTVGGQYGVRVRGVEVDDAAEGSWWIREIAAIQGGGGAGRPRRAGGLDLRRGVRSGCHQQEREHSAQEDVLVCFHDCFLQCFLLSCLFHQLDLARPPLLGEERLLRAVEAQEQEPALARHRLNPGALLGVGWLGWAEINGRGAVRVRHGSR